MRDGVRRCREALADLALPQKALDQKRVLQGVNSAADKLNLFHRSPDLLDSGCRVAEQRLDPSHNCRSIAGQLRASELVRESAGNLAVLADFSSVAREVVELR